MATQLSAASKRSSPIESLGNTIIILKFIYSSYQRAVLALREDEGFQLPTEPATNALASAEKMMEWILSNQDEAKAAASQLVAEIESCFPNKWKDPRGARDRVMKSYFQLRISDKYRYFWKKVLSESIKVKPCPIFYQYIADHILEQLVKIHFPVGLGERNEHPIPQLDFQEISALRYAAGAVIRSLTNKIKRSAHPFKRELLFCLGEMLEDSGTVRMILIVLAEIAISPKCRL